MSSASLSGHNHHLQLLPPAPTVSCSSRRMAPAVWMMLCCWLLASIARASGAMNLPDGIENILGFVPQSSFKCERDGYFGDIDNDCRLFHLCQRQVGPGGRIEWRHWTYACGNQTMFNQLTLTCAFVDEAIPCKHATKFQYLNEVIHKPAEAFLTDADVTSGFSYYSNRIMSDGARQRAFEDSQLLAQIGGQQQQLQQHTTAHAEAGQSQPKVTFLKAATLPSGAATTNHFLQQPSAANIESLADEQALNQALQWSANNYAASSSNANAAPTPRRDQFDSRQSLGQEQFVQAGVGSQARRQDQVDLVQNQQFQFQHQPVGAGGSHFSQHSGAANAQTLQATYDGQRQQPTELAAGGGIASASSNERQTFSAPAATTTTTQTEAQQLNNQPTQNIQFEYSITTNHQASAPGEPANVIFRQTGNELSSRQFGLGTSGTAATTTTTTSTTTAAISEANQQATTTPRQLLQASPTSTTPSPTLVPKFTSSQRLTPTQVSTLVAPTTSTSTTTTTTTTAQPQRQQPQSLATGNTTRVATESQRQKRRPNNAANNNQQATPRRPSNTPTTPTAGRMHRAGFQSSRLTGQQRQAETTTPIVMRKGPRAGNDQVAGQALRVSASSSLVSPLEGSQTIAASSAPWSTGGGDFWRRSFDSQLMAPKFESLLLRRRV